MKVYCPSRKEAIRKKEKCYFTGKFCPNGHLALRYTSNSSCQICLNVSTAKKLEEIKRGEVSDKICRKCDTVFKDRQCPACRRKIMLRWRQKNRKKLSECQKKFLSKVKEFVKQERQKPCTDCSKSFPWYVMEFDHVNGKDNNYSTIANLTSKGNLNRIKEELKKCEIVCANCHKIRTYLRRTKPCHTLKQIIVKNLTDI